MLCYFQHAILLLSFAESTVIWFFYHTNPLACLFFFISKTKIVLEVVTWVYFAHFSFGTRTSNSLGENEELT